ncbi:response regulator transcription factor [Nocardioides nanhaiensis]|uniref:Response regulator transcription factor n=1 Tax=Nocardioides nanhaiensis TaxID=1476871 RepID=A0ABP8WXL0_9ACTN
MEGSGEGAETKRVLVVDDDPDLRALIELVLADEGLAVSTATTGREAIEAVRREEPDLVTLDLSLPDTDGTEVCRELRTFSDVYVVMVTGRDQESDRLAGLEIGADDYLVKPFSPRELRARVKALLRRPRQSTASAATVAAAPAAQAVPLEPGGGLVIVPTGRVVLLDGHVVPLTPAEVDVVAVLASEPGRVWERGELARQVWNTQFVESDYVVDLHVAGARRKLRKAAGTGSREWIRTVAGSGYVFDVAS